MGKSYEKIFENNKKWIEEKLGQDADFFKNLAEGQSPESVSYTHLDVYKRQIKNLKTELGVDVTAEMLGFTENPYPFFKSADFYILSSRYEGFPTVLFEAITLKKNIIATDVSGVKEMLKDGKLGLIVENSEEGIYEGMKKALTNSESFQQYQENLKAVSYTHLDVYKRQKSIYC